MISLLFLILKLISLISPLLFFISLVQFKTKGKTRKLFKLVQITGIIFATTVTFALIIPFVIKGNWFGLFFVVILTLVTLHVMEFYIKE